MNKKVKISVVGIGLMGLQHIKAIKKSKFSSLHSIVEIKTKGDKIQDRNLDRSIDKGFFVKEIQDSLIEEKIESLED